MFKESGHLILLVSHFHPDHLGRIEHGLPQQFFNDTDKKKMITNQILEIPLFNPDPFHAVPGDIPTYGA